MPDETLNVLTDTQEPVVEVQETEIDNSEVTALKPVEEAANPLQSPQSHEDNQAAKAARMQAEAAANAQIAQLKAEQDEFAKTFGYSTYADLVENSKAQQIQEEANKKGLSVEEITAQREKEYAFEQIKRENEALKAEMNKVYFSKDLEAIRAAFPTEKAKEVEDLGEDFIKLRANGVSVLTAYRAVIDAKAAVLKPVPPQLGEVNSTSTKEKDFYSSEEANALTGKDLENPKIMERVMKSMTRWGR